MPLKKVDWRRIDETEIEVWLGETSSTDEDIQNHGIGALSAYLTPWDAYEPYYYDSAGLLAMVKREAILLVIPYLIELLNDYTITNKVGILDMLYNFTWYSDLEDRISDSDIADYRFHAHRIYNIVYMGLEVYKRLLEHEQESVRQEARVLWEKLRYNKN
jgi:hypothetical protein